MNAYEFTARTRATLGRWEERGDSRPTRYVSFLKRSARGNGGTCKRLRPPGSSIPAVSEEMYLRGEYARRNPGWHEEDAPWKARHVGDILADHGICPASLVDVGCGTGGVLESLRSRFPEARLVGYDISSDGLAGARRSAGVELRIGHVGDISGQFDVLICLDVLEHVEDYIGFLRSLRGHAEWSVFHIPLDLSAQTVIRERPILRGRQQVGHLHYFTRGTALATLQAAGFKILDDRLILAGATMPNRRTRTQLATVPRRVVAWLNPDLSARALGGCTLLVLARSGEQGGGIVMG